MLGLGELTIELRNIQQRVDYWAPRAESHLVRAMDQVDQVLAEWRKLEAKLEQLRAESGVDLVDLARKAAAKVKGAADGG